MQADLALTGRPSSRSAQRSHPASSPSTTSAVNTASAATCALVMVARVHHLGEGGQASAGRRRWYSQERGDSPVGSQCSAGPLMVRGASPTPATPGAGTAERHNCRPPPQAVDKRQHEGSTGVVMESCRGNNVGELLLHCRLIRLLTGSAPGLPSRGGHGS
ncbi:hypothetical protein NDU88_002117 [Pleurodeles waltl]|uniref:Uncharacterized protein n=1 Tax=Pleurodeles waltl TaxID=8319 RepID=A0AAV7P9W9_PLEWA|nr:hypothetical protein NDU88_002117 [Pleurodeles waltl]